MARRLRKQAYNDVLASINSQGGGLGSYVARTGDPGVSAPGNYRRGDVTRPFPKRPTPKATPRTSGSPKSSVSQLTGSTVGTGAKPPAGYVLNTTNNKRAGQYYKVQKGPDQVGEYHVYQNGQRVYVGPERKPASPSVHDLAKNFAPRKQRFGRVGKVYKGA